MIPHYGYDADVVAKTQIHTTASEVILLSTSTREASAIRGSSEKRSCST